MTPQKLLTGLLGVQVLLAAVTWWPGAGETPSRAVFPFDADAVTQMRVQSATTDNDANPDGLVLERRGEDWVVKSEYGYPAIAEKVDEVLDKLVALKVRDPITLQSASHDQLNVGDSATRRVTLTAGDQEVAIRLGVAGNNRSHLRFEGENPVYIVSGLGAWAVRDSSNGYIERKALDVKAGDLETYTLENPAGSFTLVRGPDNGWTSPSLQDGQQLDPEKVSKLFRETLSVNITRPADPALDPFGRPGAAIVRWSAPVDGQSVENAVAIIEHDGNGIVRVQDQALPVMSGSINMRNTFMQTTLDRLLVGAPEAPVEIH
ncbi:MAG: DUF4340 domain-containing protein [Myxococcota bacterium]